MQSYPVLASATVNGGQTVITGTLNSQASKAYHLQFFADTFCDPSGHGEARYYVGDAAVTTDASGNASFAAVLGVAIPAGLTLAATAIDPDHNTSELSACISVQ